MNAPQPSALAPNTDPVFVRRMRLIALIEHVLSSTDPDATVEDALAVLTSALCSILVQTGEGQAAYSQFLQDFAVTWREGQKRMQSGT